MSSTSVSPAPRVMVTSAALTTILSASISLRFFIQAARSSSMALSPIRCTPRKDAA
jgi:hypothetical protein